MGEWYIVRGNMDDGCKKYSARVIVCADTVKEAQAQAKAKNHLETDADCLFVPADVSRLDENKVY